MRKASAKAIHNDEEELASKLLSTYGDLADGNSEIPDAIDDPAWVRSTGKTPLEFLTGVYRHPLVQMRDRIAAAKTVVEYTHRKLPSSVELTGSNGGPVKVSRTMLSALSDKEIATMEALLEKAARSSEL